MTETMSVLKARFKRRTLHVPIAIAKIKETLLQTAVIVDQNDGEMWERQIVEIKSLLFLQVRSSRKEQVEEGHSRCS